MILEMHAIASGEVQGVGFRAATQRLSQYLGLKGFVRNLPGGSVEIVAQGKNEDLERLLSDLKKRFSADFETQIGPAGQLFENFSVL